MPSYTNTRTQIIDLDTQVVISDEFRRKRRPHRDPAEGPAILVRDARTGVANYEVYAVNGKLHREDGPAKIHRNEETGVVREAAFYTDGVRHREPKEGPALIKRSPRTGVMVEESYYVHGLLHRNPVDGPARIERDERTGEITNQEYYRCGKPAPAPKRRMLSQRCRRTEPAP